MPHIGFISFSRTHPIRLLVVSLLWAIPIVPALAEEGTPVEWSNTFSGHIHDCLIEPMVVAAVGSPVQGIIDQLLVDRSDIISAGQAIALLKSDVEAASLDHAKLRASMESEIAARDADLKLATLNLNRQADMHKQGLIPQQEFDEAVARKQVANAALIQAIENIQLLQVELRRAKHLLEQRTLRSPVDGIVVEQHAFPGEFIYDNPVMTVAQVNPLRVEVVLPARLFGRYRVGDSARVIPEIGLSSELLAHVDVVDRLLDTRSGTFGIRLILDNPELEIPGGQKCQLEFIERMAEDSH